jgi:hypothetical protein
MPLTTRAILANALRFQIGWFAAVLGAAHGRPGTGALLALALAAWSLARAQAPRATLALIALVTMVGGLWDSALGRWGGLRLQDAGAAGLAPAWIFCLWALFATTLEVSLRWLQGRWALATLLGAVAGPLAYWGGARLDAARLEGPQTLALIALGWAALLPCFIVAARRLAGRAVPAAGADTEAAP